MFYDLPLRRQLDAIDYVLGEHVNPDANTWKAARINAAIKRADELARMNQPSINLDAGYVVNYGW